MAPRTHYARLMHMSKDAMSMFLSRYMNCETGECPVKKDCRKKAPSESCYKEFRRWLDLIDVKPKKFKEEEDEIVTSW